MNKTMLVTVFAALALCAGVAEAADPAVKCTALDKTYLIGEAVGKDSPYYKVGDEIVYSMKLRGVGEGLKADDWNINWTRTGDDGIVEKGTAALPVEDPLVIRTKATKPGSVKVEAKLVGRDGKVYNKQGCHDWESYIFFTGTALVEPEKVTRVEEPADFDAFWKGVKAKLAAVPMEVLERRQIKVDGPNADVFAIKVACAGARPVTGYLSLPKSRKPGDKYPARVEFDGYGCGKMLPYDGGLGQREVLFHINAHGYDLEREGAYYKEFNDSISLDNMGYAFSEKQNAKPETAYFYGMTLRVMRALEFVKSLPEWDGRNLTSSGGSQGGLQSVWAGGLDPDVTEVISEITWCCDLGGERFGRIRGGWYIKGTDALRYFDPVNHAKRIKPRAKFTCPRAGLGDYTCPPMGLWMLYNAVPCAKSIRWVQGSTHGTVPPKPNQVFEEKAKKDVVVIVAAHPDDLAISLGFCHLAKNVYDLHVIDYTHGERGCGEEKFKSGWTKATRTKEEESVCKTINATLHWLDEIDGEAYAGRETCHKLADLIKELQPRAVIGHWPVDIHTDHVMTGAAMLRAVFLSGVKCEVWFSEQTYQSKRWTPDVFVDVTSVMDDVVESLSLYVCQLQGGSMVEHQKLARRFYGFQSRDFYDGYCEGYKALVSPMAGDRTIFTDLPKPRNFCENFEFEGVRE